MNTAKSKSELLGIAIDYDSKLSGTPRVSLSGKNETAKEMLKIARRYGVKIHRDSGLAEVLSSLEADEMIPAELYAELAEIFVFYGIDNS